MTVAGVVLAGGRSRRMGGGDKALLVAGGLSLLERTLAAARLQAGPLVLSANAEAVRLAASGLPVVADPLPGFAGPLAGILAGLEWAAVLAPGARWMASFAVDAPLFPGDLVARLVAAAERDGADLACAASGGRRHPVFGLWPVALAGDLRRAVAGEGVRRIEDWTGRYRLAVAEWPAAPADPFHNVNTPQDLDRLRASLAGTPMF